MADPKDTADLQSIPVRVLVVDDDADFCENLWQTLRERGYRVCIAANEREGIARATSVNYDFAVIDLRLNGGDGRHVIRSIRNVNPQARIIVVTGFVDELRTSDTADAVLSKPISTDALLAHLRHFG